MGFAGGDSRRLVAIAFFLVMVSALVSASLVASGISSEGEARLGLESRPATAAEGLRRIETGLFSSVSESAAGVTTSSATTSKAICSVVGDVILRGHVEIGSPSASGGDVHANGDIWLRGIPTVCDEAAATGTVCLRGKAKAGSIEESVDPISGPEIVISKYSREADEGVYWDGTCKIQDSCSLGPMYVAGDLVVSGGALVTLCGTVYVEGDIRLDAGCCIEGSGVLVAEGDVTILGELLLVGDCDRLLVSVYGDTKVTGNGYVMATLCALDGGVFLAGNCVVDGAAVGMTVTCTGNTSVGIFSS